MLELLQSYQKKLSNLGARNRSLFLPKIYSSHYLDLQSLTFNNGLDSYHTLAQLLASKASVSIGDVFNPRDGETNKLSQSIQKLFRTDKLINQERGVQDLAVGFPFVQGQFSNGSFVRCPLLLIPVRLEKTEKKWLLKRVDSPRFNKNFLLAQAMHNGIPLNNKLWEEDFSEFPKNLDEFILYLYNYLKEVGFDQAFSRQLFEKNLHSFHAIIKEQYTQWPIGELSIKAQGVLGVFPQSSSYIDADYKELIAQAKQNPQGDGFEQFINKNLGKRALEKDLCFPLQYDASQEAVIHRIHQGDSVVVQGPPGSGKSQLITNLMSHFASMGKRVLLVCQKKAALDTVQSRFREIGLEAFTATVHDFKADRKQLYFKIAAQINSIPTFEKHNKSLNTILSERDFSELCTRIEKNSRQLEELKASLFTTNLKGISPRELYLKCEHVEIQRAVPIPAFKTLKLQEIKSFEFKLEQLLKLSEPLENIHPLIARRKPCSYKTINDAETDFEQVENFLLKFPFEEYSQWLQIENSIDKFTNTFSLFDNTQAIDNSTRINHKWEGVLPYFEVLQKHNFQELISSIETVKQQRKWLKPIQELLSKDWNLIKSFCKSVGIPARLEFIEPYIKAFEDIIELKSVLKIKDIHLVSSAIKDLNTTVEIKKRLATLNLARLSYFDLNEELNGFKNAKTQVESIISSYFKNTELRDIFKADFSKLKNEYITRFEIIQAMDDLLEALSEDELEIYRKVKTQPQPLKTFEASWIKSFIEQYEAEYPILSKVHTPIIELWEENLQSDIKKKQKISTQNLLNTLQYNASKSLETNRLGNTTTYRELAHQVNKKKRIWPIRQLLEKFNDEIFKLIPCWLASPETVSAIFPLEQYFDLVIFDEASQCYVEKGIPAMFRGKQIMIAGDNMQLQPTNLYEVRYEDPENENYQAEIDSLLQFGEQHFETYMLTGHYRSESTDLINFSNKHFYQGKLRAIPSFNSIDNKIQSLYFHKVEGLWSDQQNHAEAEKVSSIVKRLQATNLNYNIGVVTFNHKQAILIEDMLDDHGHVSIKNIENIQGNEYDVVIFSVAYAQDNKGKLRHQFGLLNQEGGENRLNVAITRAKKEVHVVCSIDPSELKVEELKNEGPRLLKLYLQYVQKHAQPLAQSLDSMSHLDKFSRVGDTNNLILPDGAPFYESYSAKDYFAYTPALLEQKGWQYTRSWSRTFYKNSL